MDIIWLGLLSQCSRSLMRWQHPLWFPLCLRLSRGFPGCRRWSRWGFRWFRTFIWGKRCGHHQSRGLRAMASQRSCVRRPQHCRQSTRKLLRRLCPRRWFWASTRQGLWWKGGKEGPSELRSRDRRICSRLGQLLPTRWFLCPFSVVFRRLSPFFFLNYFYWLI